MNTIASRSFVGTMCTTTSDAKWACAPMKPVPPTLVDIVTW